MAIEQFDQIPGRVFLDTCVVNLLIDHSETIHDNCAPSRLLTEHVASDVEALRNLWMVRIGDEVLHQLEEILDYQEAQS